MKTLHGAWDNLPRKNVHLKRPKLIPQPKIKVQGTWKPEPVVRPAGKASAEILAIFAEPSPRTEKKRKLFGPVTGGDTSHCVCTTRTGKRFPPRPKRMRSFQEIHGVDPCRRYQKPRKRKVLSPEELEAKLDFIRVHVKFQTTKPRRQPKDPYRLLK
jgi:hypothetical protein